MSPGNHPWQPGDHPWYPIGPQGGRGWLQGDRKAPTVLLVAPDSPNSPPGVTILGKGLRNRIKCPCMSVCVEPSPASHHRAAQIGTKKTLGVHVACSSGGVMRHDIHRKRPGNEGWPLSAWTGLRKSASLSLRVHVQHMDTPHKHWGNASHPQSHDMVWGSVR